MDRSSIISCFWCFYSLTASRHMIYQHCFFLTPARQISWHHLDTSFVEIYWWSIYSPHAIRNSLLSISLSLDTLDFSSPKPLSLTPNLFPWDSQAFSSFSSLGKLLISFIYMHFMFWNLGFGVFEKFWGFSKLMKYCWNFGLVFEDLILKTPCIALHLLYNSIIMHLDVCNLFLCW